MVYLALMSHVNACMWYAAGRDSETGWTSRYEDRPVMFQYLVSMHWALTQFQGTSDVVPGSSMLERAYAVICVLLSLLILSCFVSSLTNMMMQLQALHAKMYHESHSVRS